MERLSQVTNPFRGSETGRTTTQYDWLGRVKSITCADGSIEMPDPVNNQETVTDPGSKDRTTTRDALGRLIQVAENPSGSNFLTNYLYNAADSLLAVGQGSQSNCTVGSTSYSRCFGYDAAQRLLSANNPESATVTYGYDSNGSLTGRTDARSISLTVTYDFLNRVIKKT